jgi:hypothetical protein
MVRPEGHVLHVLSAQAPAEITKFICMDIYGGGGGGGGGN